MKKLFIIIIIFISFQTLSKADDIRDFQIEGMSIGDSLLNLFSEEELIEQFKINSDDVKLNKREALIKGLTKNIAIKKGVKMEDAEMKELLKQLFQCDSPFINPSGKSTFFNFTAEEINNKLG